MNNIENVITMQLNPTQAMAHSGLIGCAANGDEDAIAMLKTIKEKSIITSPSPTPQKEVDLLRKVSAAYCSVAWARHYVTDTLFNALRMSNFVDLGCGINQRSIRYSRMKDVHYFGIDFPRVIDAVRQTTLSIIAGAYLDYRIHLCATDVTDYDSLRFAINARGPIFITTEGLMMYLTEKEMITAVENINRLLSEFGGVWVTDDMYAKEFNDSVMKELFPVAEKDAGTAVNNLMTNTSKGIVFDNSFVTLKDDEHDRFMADLGFNSRNINVWKYITNLKIPPEIRSAFKNMRFKLFTSEIYDSRTKSTVTKSRFDVDSTNEAGEVTIKISGRLDTVTAPKLIKVFEERMKDPIFNSINVDMSSCPYISSAGIRALLMIYKRVTKQGGTFSMKNLCPEVYEIIEVTGFSDFM